MTTRLLHLQGEATATIVVIFLVTQALSSLSVHARVISGGGCVASEREALLNLKESFLDPAGRLSSWRGEDCCQWEGVGCSNRIGHVVKLDLRCQSDSEAIMLRGGMSSSIATLNHLKYLDLSFNDFNYTNIPLFLGTLSNLRYLSLSDAGFSGSVPSQLGNLSRLQHLDLSFNGLEVSDLSWLPRLSSLKSLNMSYVDLSHARDWVRMINMLPNLKIISLSSCQLNSTVSTLSHSNLTHLEILDLSYNEFNSLLQHNWFWGLTSIKGLLLSGSGWSGAIPDALGNMSSLEVLYLDYNILTGTMPQTTKNLCNLQQLDFSWTGINGFVTTSIPQCSSNKLRKMALQGANLIAQLPVWIGNLTNLEYLDISANRIFGRVPSGIGNLRSLSYLDLSQNMLVGSLPSSIGNMRSLTYLDLSKNMLNGSIPSGIGNMRSLTHLDLSKNMLMGDVADGIGLLSNLTFLRFDSNNLSGVLSEVHFMTLVKLDFLNLSKNSLKLDFAKDWVPPFRLKEGHFGSCDMGPSFPAWLKWQAGIQELHSPNTRINDVFPHWFWAVLSSASNLDLSRNQLIGALPANLELPFIAVMDLSRNSLSGQLPVNLTAPCLRNLLLYNNYLTGTIPAYVCYVLLEINLSNNQLTGDSPECPQNTTSLLMVDLKNNSLSGEFPRFFPELGFLDLSHNKFSGSVPTWIAEQMPNLEVLILRSNMFHGHLPMQLTKLDGLHYLDVAHNNISGSIPSSLARLKAMTQASNDNGDGNYSSDSISTFIKDRELNYTHEFTKNIVLIDMSSNSFTGYIPKELFLLKALRSLNLSNNQISGPIPDDIGALRELESLDLSYNYFTGKIPSGLSDLTFLSCLNLSYNDLSGGIPSGQQLQTLNNQYMYIGNPRLCGPPLLNSCSMNGTNPSVNQEHEGGRSSLYLSMITGFVMGLWTVFCAMLFMKTWRIAYFQLWDTLYDKAYVQVAISKAAFLRKCGDEER
ncbi:hypothetical protein SEVIR_5G222700v4 [Setaria viridis]|uniref:Uncharacterized protein n=1 Tax=Setaria viridis TaxID=4556 RepID=A0A4U6UK99_SETVI|nr:hypothetical protein SEVIR_5G222700v2 [Setaria viridis]